MQHSPELDAFLAAALAEDIGAGDITSEAVIPADSMAKFAFVAREPMVVAGLEFLPGLFAKVDPKLRLTALVKDGATLQAGDQLATLEGPTRALLTAERTALNLIQQLSGVATLTRRYVEAVAGTKATIIDTRKTIPGMRDLQKYAVRMGGGQNHRCGLYDGILIKDNHLAVAGSVAKAVEMARRYVTTVTPTEQSERRGISRAERGRDPGVAGANRDDRLWVEIECDTLAQLDEALAAGADIVLLDNMDIATLTEAVKRARASGVITEASGGVSLETVRVIAQTGVDRISIGRLTHSAPAVDIGLDAF